MINVNELRIGNWLISSNDEASHRPSFYQVKGVLEDEIDIGYIKLISPSALSPILLSKKILEQCGFVKYVDANFKETLMRNHKLALQPRFGGYLTIVWFDADDDYGTTMAIQINLLHQLQNIYFLMCREELKFK